LPLIAKAKGNQRQKLMHKNINDSLIRKLNVELDMNLSDYYYIVKANVALASAVTSYSRIHMIPFKANGLAVYTDSIFTSKKLDLKILGTELGLMKDELNRVIIKEAYFLGIKKYLYIYEDKNGKLITKSVFAGIEIDSLTFSEIIKLSEGYTLTKEIPLRFYKSLKSLSINIDTSHLTISKSLDKPLIDNKYLPLHIELNPQDSESKTFFNYLKRKILVLIKWFKF
jgi:hypothetical protein